MADTREPTAVKPDEPETRSELRSRFGFDGPENEWFAALRAASSPLALGAFGPYRLLEELGGGGQGRVYKALQPGTNRPIAIKRLWAGALAGARARARFEREIEAASALSHPGVVAVLGADSVEGQTLLLMEWVDGETIDRWADRDRPPGAVLGVFTQLCDAVAHAHQHGVLHRDLKPSNVLVDREARVRVLDFGLAKVLGSAGPGDSRSAAGEFAGTPAYAAPEQLSGRAGDVDTRADVYALGVILYRLLTAELPFGNGDDLPALFDAIRAAEPRRPSALRPALGRELDAIVLKAMSKERERRYQSAGELAADIRRFLAGETVLAHPPSLGYHAAKFVRRHRLTVLTVGAALVLILGAGIVSSVLALRLAARSGQLFDRTQDLALAVHAAQEAQRHAEQNAARQEATAELLLDMLTSVSQAVRAGDQNPGAGVLARARARLEAGGFADQPALRVALWRTIADASRTMGFTADAEQDLARALAICEESLDPRHVERGRCLTIAGLFAEGRGDYAAAERLYHESYELLRASLGELHGDTARALNNRGCALKDLARFDESRRCLEAALAARRALYGDVDRAVATTTRNLGTLMLAERKPEEAGAYYRRALDIATRACGPDDPTTMFIHIRLARVLEARGGPVEAEAMLRSVLTRAVEIYGARRLEPAMVEQDLAFLLARRQRFAESVDLLWSCLQRNRLCLGPGDLSRLRAELNYGVMLQRAGRETEAEEQLRHALHLATEAGDEDTVRRATEWLGRAPQPTQPPADEDPPPGPGSG